MEQRQSSTSFYLVHNTEPSNFGPIRLVAIGRLAGKKYLMVNLAGTQHYAISPRYVDQEIEAILATEGVVYVAELNRRVEPGGAIDKKDVSTWGYGVISRLPAIPASSWKVLP